MAKNTNKCRQRFNHSTVMMIFLIFGMMMSYGSMTDVVEQIDPINVEDAKEINKQVDSPSSSLSSAQSTSPSQPEPQPELQPQLQSHHPYTHPNTNLPKPPINFTSLNQKLQTLNPNFLNQFSQIYTVQRIKLLNDQQTGQYLFLLGKMYLYNIIPDKIEYYFDENYNRNLHFSKNKNKNKKSQVRQQYGYSSTSKYILGYFYLRTSAEVYQNPDAYYYIAMLQYMKLTPITLIKNNIKKIIKNVKNINSKKTISSSNSTKNNAYIVKLLKQWQESNIKKHQAVQTLEQIVNDMQTHHLHNTQQNLYLSSVLGQTPAKLTLAYMLKDGISTQRNCSSALGYYLSALKATKIDTFQYPSDYIDQQNFQKQLYARKKVDLKGYGEYDPSVLMETTMFDQQTLHAYQQVAVKYMTGEDGFPVNETISVRMFQKMIDTSKLARVMLGYMYLKGRGVQRNYNRAREMFQMEGKNNRMARQTLTVMKFYNLGFTGRTSQALVQIGQLYAEYERKMIKMDNATLFSMKQAAAANANAKQNTNTNTNKDKTQDPQKNPPSQQKQQPNQPQQQQQDKSSSSSTQRGRKQTINIFRTPMMKYLAGVLALGDQIKSTDKKYAIFLIDQAAKQGNTLALIQMALIMIDGSDSSFDCARAANYFSKQALSLVAFQQRVELAKLGIKNKKYFFSFIKYVQLMMVGYKNAFVNALYMTQVYGEQMFDFGKESWSVGSAKKNSVYKLLMKQQMIMDIERMMLDTFMPTGYEIFTQKNIQYLTQLHNQIIIPNNPNNKNPQTQPSSQPNPPQKPQHPPQIQQYLNYINLKITSIGIQKHQISILKFYKYKQSKDVSILHQLANIGQDSPHIYESRFLLGKYYHHTNISGVQQQIRFRRALQQYGRATKNRLLAEMIYIFEGGDHKYSQKIFNHFLWYVTGIIIVLVFLYWKKNKKLDEILLLEEKKIQEEQRQLNMRNNSDKFINNDRDSQNMMNLRQTNSNNNLALSQDQKFIKQERVSRENFSELKNNQFLFNRNPNNMKNQNINIGISLSNNEQKIQRGQKQKEPQYKGPKFSEQQQQNMINRRNLMSIGLMLDEKLKNINKDKKQDKKEDKSTITFTFDQNQPVITDEEQTNKPHHA